MRGDGWFHSVCSKDDYMTERVEPLYKLDDVLQRIWRAAPVLISIKNVQGEILAASDHFDQLELPPRSQWLGKSIKELFAPAIAQRIAGYDQQALAQQRPISFIEEWKTKQGKHETYRAVSFPLITSEEKAVCTIAVSRHGAHSSSNDELPAVLSALVEGVLKIELDGAVSLSNTAARELLQLPETSQQNWLPDWHVVDEEGKRLSAIEFLQALQAFATRDETHKVVRFCADSNASKWLMAQAQPLYRDNEKKPYATVASLVPIDQLKKAEHELAIYADLLERTSEAIIVYNAERRIIKVNRAFSKLTGYSADDVVGAGPEVFRTPINSPERYQQIDAALTVDGCWQGEVERSRRDGSSFTAWLTCNRIEDGHGELSHFISIFSDISEIKHQQRTLDYLAHHDSLTGLPNRNLLFDRIDHAINVATRKNGIHALLFIDLDHFKEINDSAGHGTGDKVLIEAARRMQLCTRKQDTLARLGGDEFMLFMEGVTSKEEVSVVANRLLNVISAPYQIEHKEFFISASIGISYFPEDGNDVEALLTYADIAMYQAKSSGRNRLSWYNRRLSEELSERVSLERALHRALGHDELFVVYQPQIDVLSGQIIGAEALLRWQHPERGLVSPALFIPIAEKTGLINAIGDWVLDQVCRQIAEWDQQGLNVPLVAVNVSAQQLGSEQFADRVLAHLIHHQLSSERLELELTESVLMCLDDANACMRRFADAGIRLAIDDFGTGFSSLAYLRALPVQRLKIDRSFLMEVPGNRNDESIVRAVIGLAHNLNIDVIAEGVETELQQQFLHQNHCYAVQGYLHGKPIKANDFAAYLRRTSPSENRLLR
ncbi:PAS domain S-box-containing protein/diguanylate cyclase (GGDEF)-like protein [Permianibacter aggregans]|uniref:cyclic-guanylate-specific phosphodiesterase n=2 Tax=Permianibacter aggregans TaxID=1510150 RepID=A0A4R6UQA0_9GAMM|nr:PAS domain S-box-containing protein/diguanylate cyclase (GGDEF)-like protein [Permianibacter aggregans]